jgi:hypothetical protein
MDIFPGSVLVDVFDIQAAVGLVLLATVIAVVVTAAVREHRASLPVHRDEEPQA